MLFHERQNHELLQTHMDMFAAAEYKNLCCEHFSANRMLQVCLEHTKITMQHVHYTVHNICSTHGQSISIISPQEVVGVGKGDRGCEETRHRQGVSSVPLRCLTAVHLHSGTGYNLAIFDTSSSPTGNDGGLGGGNSKGRSSSWHWRDELLPLLEFFFEAIHLTSGTTAWYSTPHCDELSCELSHGKVTHSVGRERAPLIPGGVVLEDMKFVIRFLS